MSVSWTRGCLWLPCALPWYARDIPIFSSTSYFSSSFSAIIAKTVLFSQAPDLIELN